VSLHGRLEDRALRDDVRRARRTPAQRLRKWQRLSPQRCSPLLTESSSLVYPIADAPERQKRVGFDRWQTDPNLEVLNLAYEAERPARRGKSGSSRQTMTHSSSVRNFKGGGPSRDRRRPGRRPFQTLNLGLFCHF
jgi:hypothetical protein